MYDAAGGSGQTRAMGAAEMYFIEPIVSCTEPRDVNAVYPKLYHGWSIDSWKLGPGANAPLFINVEGGHVMIPGTRLILRGDIEPRIRPLARYRPRRPNICCAFSYPIDPDDGLDQAIIKMQMRIGLERALERWVRTHARPVETPDLVEVRATTPCRSRKVYGDETAYEFGSPTRLVRTEATISPSLVEEYGIAWDMGYFVADRVMDVLAPYVDNLYFYVHRI